MKMEIVIIKTAAGHMEMRIVKGGEETLDGEIARYPVEEGFSLKLIGGCKYECTDSCPYIDIE